MLRRFPKTCLNLLLAATVLVGGGFPPAMRHAHEAGNDLSHRHDCGHERHAGGKTQIAQAVHPGQGISCDPALVSAKHSHSEWVRHLHFKLLSLQLTLPDNRTPSNNQDRDPSPELVFVRVGREMTPSTAHANQDSVRMLAPVFLGALSDNPANALSTASAFGSVASTLLCDRARHERSGVQLI